MALWPSINHLDASALLAKLSCLDSLALLSLDASAPQASPIISTCQLHRAKSCHLDMLAPLTKSSPDASLPLATFLDGLTRPSEPSLDGLTWLPQPRSLDELTDLSEPRSLDELTWMPESSSLDRST